MDTTLVAKVQSLNFTTLTNDEKIYYEKVAEQSVTRLRVDMDGATKLVRILR
jgi:hypothetical protein